MLTWGSKSLESTRDHSVVPMPLLLLLLPWMFLAIKSPKPMPPFPEPRKRYMATIAFASSTRAVSLPHVLDMRACRHCHTLATLDPLCMHTFTSPS